MKWTKKEATDWAMIGINEGLKDEHVFYENENGWVIEGTTPESGHSWRAWKSYSDMIRDYEENWPLITLTRNWAKYAIVNWTDSFEDAKLQVELI